MFVDNVDSSGFYVLFVPHFILNWNLLSLASVQIAPKLRFKFRINPWQYAGDWFLKKLPDNLSKSYESESFYFIPNWDKVIFRCIGF